MMTPSDMEQRVALITGSAARIGAAIAARLHAKGFAVVLHYHNSLTRAEQLCRQFNEDRPGSAIAVQADLLDAHATVQLARQALGFRNRLDVLINNASAFYPTPLDETDEARWQELMGSNALAPLLLCRELVSTLRAQQGCVINLTDIAVATGRADYVIYTMAKAALAGLTRSLARELAPEVRVNAIAPGYILPPNHHSASGVANPTPDPLSYSCLSYSCLSYSCLNYPGSPEDIAAAVAFLIEQSYITGQTLTVDGGRRFKF